MEILNVSSAAAILESTPDSVISLKFRVTPNASMGSNDDFGPTYYIEGGYDAVRAYLAASSLRAAVNIDQNAFSGHADVFQYASSQRIIFVTHESGPELIWIGHEIARWLATHKDELEGAGAAVSLGKALFRPVSDVLRGLSESIKRSGAAQTARRIKMEIRTPEAEKVIANCEMPMSDDEIDAYVSRLCGVVT